jgi:hypothetical protein
MGKYSLETTPMLFMITKHEKKEEGKDTKLAFYIERKFKILIMIMSSVINRGVY